jgi:MoaA/NifB/PqqE/SkfB family radical SAM enzyme
LSELENFRGLNAPLLCDLKITDNCPYGCKFCYQGSTSKGKHATFEQIESIVDSLSSAGVLSVAIGGGEPTLHPDFINILNLLASKGIQANFTTRNTSWLRDGEVSKYISKGSLTTGHSVAFSVDTLKDMEDIYDRIISLKEDISPDRFQFQAVSGVVKLEDFKEMFAFAAENGLNFTILGYKDPLIKTNDLTEIIRTLEKNWRFKDFKLSFDTCFAATVDFDALKKACKKQGIPINSDNVLFKEGLVSCYIDCVEGFISKSSYETQKRVPLSEGIVAAFNKVRTSV